MAIPLTFLEASSGKPMAKTFRQQETLSYPLVKNVTSHHYETEATLDGIRERFSLIKQHAGLNHCMLKGPLTRQLSNESRKGTSDSNAPSQTLVIDLDGLSTTGLDLPIPDQFTGNALKDLAEKLIQYLPEVLHNTTYIVHASSSLGRKAHEISLHLEFMLAQPVKPAALKLWLKGQNFSCEALKDRLSLTRSGMNLHWLIDPSLADNSRIIYIAPPIFEGVDDPFSDDDARWQLIEKEAHSVDILAQAASLLPAGINALRQERLNALRKAIGLKKHNPKTRMLLDEGRRVSVIQNPDEMTIELHRVDGEYAIFDVNGGDSHSYWCRLSNPEIIYNFKGEEPFEFAKADPQSYQNFMEQFGGEVIKRQDLIPMVVRDINTDTHFCFMYDQPEDRVTLDPEGNSSLKTIQRANIEDFLAEHGKPVPDPMPQWHLVFRPQNTQVMQFQEKVLNTYTAPDHIRNPQNLLSDHCGITYKVGHECRDIRANMQLLAPTCHKLLWHVLGQDTASYNHFINWLAFVIQNRDISGTAWILSGTQGTGKGILQSQVLNPLIGKAYHRHVTMDNLEDRFNSNMARTLMYTVDEFRLGDSREANHLIDRIKNYITEGHGELRGMHREAQTQRIYANWLFFSNHSDVMPIPDGDRRMNVAEPQRRKLMDVHPELQNEIHQLEAEIGTLAAFLLNFNVNELAARNPLENDAKQRMKVASLNTSEQFCYALRTGDFDYFAEHALKKTETVTDTNQVIHLHSAKEIISTWAASVELETACNVSIDEAFRVWQALNSERSNNINKFRTMLARNDVDIQQTNIEGRPVSIITVIWKPQDSDITRLKDSGLVDSLSGATPPATTTGGMSWLHKKPVH
ncbi:hypothetical protein DV711_06340 [Motiliproteus coralliicola]|uniref:NrS-1 polymerase-like helicase domain-containing protein n=1 Tax=Motiliproteus coralliicola TaxID=2283196 RepID=A0A369WU23_9GAMM|nr:primase-helicase family protein [Motiliproteus coralliicola]RDE25172.1 hypothetical protein DV711_06340 [Motiliproteus coralliicola]